MHLNSKYPEISCVEEREKYRAVFNDQYQEYKDLHRDVSTTLSKFTELDAAMARLLSEGKSQQVTWMLNTTSTLCDITSALKGGVYAQLLLSVCDRGVS